MRRPTDKALEGLFIAVVYGLENAETGGDLQGALEELRAAKRWLRSIGLLTLAEANAIAKTEGRA